MSSTTYYPAANGLAKSFNKTIRKLLKKFILKGQRDWDDKLGECLWTYRMTVRTLMKATSFFLLYRCEAVLSLEIQIPSLRVTLTTRMMNEEKHRLRLQELEVIGDKVCKPNSMSSIKPKFSELLIRKSENRFSRRAILFQLLEDP